ncbi:hypothetical protein F2Q69_00058068 [Brassica cretica]|uniref:Uncharacterized protein n=1 Tax=Brassica cretica TaxID=69181 RepID=A0A8S9N9B8_BRACR|nr:hypothetical protein F2Q69_00058068 [Brassica cretica]
MCVLPRTCGGEALNRDTKVRVFGTRLRRVRWRCLAVEAGDSEACAAVDKRGDGGTLNGEESKPKTHQAQSTQMPSHGFLVPAAARLQIEIRRLGFSGADDSFRFR